MFENDWMLLKLAQERRRDLLRQLERDRLIRQAELTPQPHGHMVYHIMDGMGRQLIRWGERLQARHAMHHRQTLIHTTRG